MSRVLRFLRSPQLALSLCIVLALFAALGTLSGRAGGSVRDSLGSGSLCVARALGITDTFRSPLFIALLALLSLNVAFCTWQRLSRVRHSTARPATTLILDALMHLSLIVLLAGGALKGALGFVGTQYLFSGQVVTTVRAGDAGTETPIGFGLLLKERAEDYYPAVFRIGVRDARSGARIGLLTVREGGEEALPGAGLRLAVDAFPREGRSVKVRATAAAGEEEMLLETVPGGATTARFADFEIVMVAWRRDLRMVRGRVAVIEGGREIKETWLAVGGRIAHRGTSVFLTAWGEDPYRNPYLGVQVARDPGAPIFWAGAALLAATMPLFLFVRRTGGKRPDGAPS